MTGFHHQIIQNYHQTHPLLFQIQYNHQIQLHQLYEGKLNEMLTKSQTYDFKNAGDTIVKQTLATKDEKLQKFQALMNEIFGTIKGNLK